MELNKKLQELRKRKDLTQEELAEFLYVSRTAVSKWESGRGYPSMDSMKRLADFFGVTIDELLSDEELPSISEEETISKEKYSRKLLPVLLDLCAVSLLVLPVFRQAIDGTIRSVSLFCLTGVSLWLKTLYVIVIIGMFSSGILLFILRNCSNAFWNRTKNIFSLGLNALGAILLIVSMQPYPAVLLFAILAGKGLFLIQKP